MKNNYIVVIGGANMDISGFPFEALRQRDSNPGAVKLSVGGVGRNIAENIVRLGKKVKFISVFGNDLYGKQIIDEACKIGLDVKDSFIKSDANTSTYLTVLDKSGDMFISISGMDIYNHLTIDMLKKKHSVISKASGIIMDTNIPQKVIEYVMKKYLKTPIYIDPVSTKKALKIKKLLPFIHILKPNLIEAQYLSGIKIKNKTDLKKVASYFIYKGVDKIFISLGVDGVYYADKNSHGEFKPKKQKVINANGAGDAFFAGLVFADLEKFNMADTARFASGAAIIALGGKDTINPKLSFKTVRALMKKI